MKSLFFSLVVFFIIPSFANPTLVIDPAIAGEIEHGCPQRIELAASASGPSVFDSILNAFYGSGAKVQKIEDSKGSLSGAPAPYDGDYTHRAYIVGLSINPAYKFGVWENIQIRYFSETGAVEISTTALNYLGSAELAEGACREVLYRQE